MARLNRRVAPLLLAGLALTGACDGADTPAPLSVRILYPYAGKGDRSFSDSAYEGLFRATQEADFAKLEIVPKDHDEAARILSEWLAAPSIGRELTIVVGYAYADILASRDWDVAGHPLLIVDVSAPARPDLLSVSYRTFAPSFLAGLAAARFSTSKEVSAIGGMAAPVVNDFIFGFRAGAERGAAEMIGPLYLAPDEAGFSMVNTARQMALVLAEEQNVDVIFPVAGASGLGVIEAAKEYSGSLFVVGVDSDQSYLGPRVIIGSVVKRIDKIVFEAILASVKGEFAAAQLSLGLETKDTEFVPNPYFSNDLPSFADSDREQALLAESAYATEGVP